MNNSSFFETIKNKIQSYFIQIYSNGNCLYLGNSLLMSKKGQRAYIPTSSPVSVLVDIPAATPGSHEWGSGFVQTIKEVNS